MIIQGAILMIMLHSPLVGCSLNGRQHQNKLYDLDLNIT